MTTFEIIKKLAQRHDKSLQQVAEDLGFSKNLFYRWKTADPKAKDLEKVADYFGVSVDYLLDRGTPSHTDIDLEKALDNAMTFEGRALTDEERTAMKEILKAYLKTKK